MKELDELLKSQRRIFESLKKKHDFLEQQFNGLRSMRVLMYSHAEDCRNEEERDAFHYYHSRYLPLRELYNEMKSIVVSQMVMTTKILTPVILDKLDLVTDHDETKRMLESIHLHQKTITLNKAILTTYMGENSEHLLNFFTEIELKISNDFGNDLDLPTDQSKEFNVHIFKDYHSFRLFMFLVDKYVKYNRPKEFSQIYRYLEKRDNSIKPRSGDRYREFVKDNFEMVAEYSRIGERNKIEQASINSIASQFNKHE